MTSICDYIFPSLQKQVVTMSRQMLILVAVTMIVSIFGCIFGLISLFRQNNHVRIPHDAIVTVRGEPYVPLRYITEE